MKTHFLSILLLCALLIGSCGRDDSDVSAEGVISELDLRECGCCGGYFVDVGQDRFRFFLEDLPDNNLDLPTRELPINVRLRYRVLEEDEPCGFMRELIEVFSISLN